MKITGEQLREILVAIVDKQYPAKSADEIMEMIEKAFGPAPDAKAVEHAT